MNIFMSLYHPRPLGSCGARSTCTKSERVLNIALLVAHDLKTYAKTDSQQTGLLNIVKTFSNDIKMEFGLDKCPKATFKRGKLTETFDLQLDTDTCIKDMTKRTHINTLAWMKVMVYSMPR